MPYEHLMLLRKAIFLKPAEPDGLSPRQGLNSSCNSLLFTKCDRTNFAAPSGELRAN